MRVQSLLCRLGLVVASVIAVAGLPSGAAAQTSTGSIRGYVTDSAGTPIAGARVVAVNVQTTAQREVATQSNGSYAILGLVPAQYDVTARQIGMAPQKVPVRVLIAEVFPLNFKLGASAVQLEAVTIAASSGVQTRTSEVGTSITPQQMSQLPTASRNFFDLAALAPGVTTAPDFVNLGSSNAGVTDRTFSYGGQGPGQVNVFIDGASLKNDLTGGESGIHGGTFGQDASRGNPFPRSAIQEYRVLTQNYKAEYQQSSGPVIVATTKSGSNDWSGDAFFNYQNKDLVAQDSISRASNFAKPDFTRYLGGLSVGGPLIKDRLFFFGSYEGNYQNRDALVNITQKTGLPAPGAFPALDTVSFANQNGNFTSPFRETLVFGKLNYTISTKSTVELSFNDRHETDVRDFGGFAVFQNAIDHGEDATTTIFKYNYFAGPWLNEANVTYEHFNQNPSLDTPNLPQRWYAFPTACCATLGSNLSVQDFTQKRVALRDDITYNAGGGVHVFKGGVSTAFLTYDISKANNLIPQFFFSSSVNTGDAGCAPTCTGNEAYNYRVPFQVVWAYGDPRVNANNTQVGAYLQDDWTPTPRLTINLGIRWDFESHMYNYDYVTPTDVRDTIHTYDLAPVTKADSLVRSQLDTTSYFTDGTQRKKFYGAFQPRIGFSYALDADSKTVIFGGWGLYYDRTYFDISVDEMLKLTRPNYTVHFADPDSTPTSGQLAWQNSYLTTDTTVLKSLITSGKAAGREVWLIANDVKIPKSSQFNFGIRHLFGDVLVSATYVGVRSWDGLVFNWANFSLNPNGSCCAGGGYGHGFSNILYTTNSAKTWYDALQIEVNRPYKRTGNWGWGGGVSFTSGTRSLSGSNAVGDVFSTFPNSADYPKHPARDEKSRIVANWTMDVPFAAGVQFSGIVTAGSGPRSNFGGNFPATGYVPGGFTPPQYPFIFPGAWSYREVDLRLRKDFPSFSGTTLGVTLAVFNAFNFNNFSYPDNLFSPNPAPSGLLSDPRRTELGVEYHF
jgi:outer membrane receptor protein involved in Fe transport